MIYLAGDMHGTLEIDKIMDFFELEVLVRKLTAADYLILLGDAGICWDDGENDAWVREKLESLPVTVLWIDGNHENFDLINSLPVSDWSGGKVQRIGKKIIHLKRGYVFEIDGKQFFAFGGGFSIDRMRRKEGISWWPEEMPSKEEYERGQKSLKQVGNKVDYVITHTAPGAIAKELVDSMIQGEEELQNYLQETAQNILFKKWYFGHWHLDCSIGDYVGLYYEILRLPDMEN